LANSVSETEAATARNIFQVYASLVWYKQRLEEACFHLVLEDPKM